MDEVDNELGGSFNAQEAGVETQVVAVGVAPKFVGVEVVVLGAEFVDLVAALLGGLLCVAVAAPDDACHAVTDGGVQEHAVDRTIVAQDVVGGSSHNDAGLAVHQILHDLALGLVDTVVAHRYVSQEG